MFYVIIGAIVLGIICIAFVKYCFKLLEKDIYIDKIRITISKTKSITITTKTKGEPPAKDAHLDKVD